MNKRMKNGRNREERKERGRKEEGIGVAEKKAEQKEAEWEKSTR